MMHSIQFNSIQHQIDSNRIRYNTIQYNTIQYTVNIHTRKRTVLKVQNFGASKTNCTASNKLDFPLPFLPTTAFVPGLKGWTSGCCLKERKFESVICLICIALIVADDYYYRRWYLLFDICDLCTCIVLYFIRNGSIAESCDYGVLVIDYTYSLFVLKMKKLNAMHAMSYEYL